MKAVELLRKHTTQFIGDAHAIKLLELLEGKNMSSERFKLILCNAGFVWFVKAVDILKFKFHVNIRGTGIKYYSSGHSIRYVGDMPDFAIERAKTALNLGIKDITLHSMEELPVTRVHIDPVMVGWIDEPKFHTDEFGELFTYRPMNEGVVLAIWNNERELEI